MRTFQTLRQPARTVARRFLLIVWIIPLFAPASAQSSPENCLKEALKADIAFQKSEKSDLGAITEFYSFVDHSHSNIRVETRQLINKGGQRNHGFLFFEDAQHNHHAL